jgi:hypothetical protein
MKIEDNDITTSILLIMAIVSFLLFLILNQLPSSAQVSKIIRIESCEKNVFLEISVMPDNSLTGKIINCNTLKPEKQSETLTTTNFCEF